MNDRKNAYELEQRRYNFVRIWGRRYNHMSLRAKGITTNKSHAAGKDIMTREEFLDWCKAKPNFLIFMVLYIEWSNSGFDLSLCPSIDRIDPDLGYTVDNIQWLSFSDNCEKNHKYVDYRGILVKERVS